MLGYVLLDTHDEYKIREVGVYYSRQAYLLKWDLSNFVAELAGRPCDLADLRDRWHDPVRRNLTIAAAESVKHLRASDTPKKRIASPSNVPHRADQTKRTVEKWQVKTILLNLSAIASDPAEAGRSIIAVTCPDRIVGSVRSHYFPFTLLEYILGKGGSNRWYVANGSLVFADLIHEPPCQEYMLTKGWKLSPVGSGKPVVLQFTRNHTSILVIDSPIPDAYEKEASVAAIATDFESLREEVNKHHQTVTKHRDVINNFFGCEMSLKIPYPKAFIAKVESPWSSTQVSSLNDFQLSEAFQPFTCGRKHDGDRILKASKDGFRCPTCSFSQSWAYEIMTNGEWRAPAEAIRAVLG